MVRKKRLISKFMTSQTSQQTIAIHILPNISQIKRNQALKLCHVIEYNKRNIFLTKLCRKWDRETSSRPLFVFQKSFIWGKSTWSAAYFQPLSIVLNLANNKNKIYKNLDYGSRDMFNFDFLEKDLGIVFPPDYVLF